MIEEFAKTIIVQGWESGRPLTVEMLEMQLREKFPTGKLKASFPPSSNDDFHDSYFGDSPSCAPKYNNWRREMLQRIGFSNLKVGYKLVCTLAMHKTFTHVQFGTSVACKHAVWYCMYCTIENKISAKVFRMTGLPKATNVFATFASARRYSSLTSCSMQTRPSSTCTQRATGSWLQLEANVLGNL